MRVGSLYIGDWMKLTTDPGFRVPDPTRIPFLKNVHISQTLGDGKKKSQKIYLTFKTVSNTQRPNGL